VTTDLGDTDLDSGEVDVSNPDGDDLLDGVHDDSDVTDDTNEGLTCPPEGVEVVRNNARAGDQFITYVPAEGIGNVAVRVTLPTRARYRDRRAGVVVNVATFFTSTGAFYTDLDVSQIGLIHVAYIWPGAEERRTGACSEGVFDHGGPSSISALRDIIRFASGDRADINGDFLSDHLDPESIQIAENNIGLWAFSHPGIAAMNVLGRYGNDLHVAYFVGRENPTQDQHSAVELGHFGEADERILNPIYDYERDYQPGLLDLDYSTARWNPDYSDIGTDVGRAYFDFDDDGFDTEDDHVMSFRIPTMWEKRYLSRSLTHALRDNGLSEADWPADLATPAEADEAWSYRNSIDQYAELEGSGLRAMLVFAERQHVQPLYDAASVHSAWDGLKGEAELWVRINPDASYAEWVSGGRLVDFPDHDANSEPDDWSVAGEEWGYDHPRGVSNSGELAGWAAVAEMADRFELNQWSDNLDEVLVPNFPAP